MRKFVPYVGMQHEGAGMPMSTKYSNNDIEVTVDVRSKRTFEKGCDSWRIGLPALKLAGSIQSKILFWKLCHMGLQSSWGTSMPICSNLGSILAKLYRKCSRLLGHRLKKFSLLELQLQANYVLTL